MSNEITNFIITDSRCREWYIRQREDDSIQIYYKKPGKIEFVVTIFDDEPAEDCASCGKEAEARGTE